MSTTDLTWVEAAQAGSIEFFVGLVSKGRKLDVVDVRGRTALHWAVEFGRDSLVSFLLMSQQIDVNARDLAGRTPLHLAVHNEMWQCYDFLASQPGVCFAVPDTAGATVLDLLAAASPARHQQLLARATRQQLERPASLPPLPAVPQMCDVPSSLSLTEQPHSPPLSPRSLSPRPKADTAAAEPELARTRSKKKLTLSRKAARSLPKPDTRQHAAKSDQPFPGVNFHADEASPFPGIRLHSAASQSVSPARPSSPPPSSSLSASSSNHSPSLSTSPTSPSPSLSTSPSPSLSTSPSPSLSTPPSASLTLPTSPVRPVPASTEAPPGLTPRAPELSSSSSASSLDVITPRFSLVPARSTDELPSSDEAVLCALVGELASTQALVRQGGVLDVARLSGKCMEIAKLLRAVIARQGSAASLVTGDELKRRFAVAVSDLKERNVERLGHSLAHFAAAVAQQLLDVRTATDPDPKVRGPALMADLALQVGAFCHAPAQRELRVALLTAYLSFLHFIVDYFLCYFQDSSLASPLAAAANALTQLGAFLSGLLLAASPDAASVEAKLVLEAAAALIGLCSAPHFYSAPAAAVDCERMRQACSTLIAGRNSDEVEQLRRQLAAAAHTDQLPLLDVLSKLDAALTRRLELVGSASPRPFQQQIELLNQRLSSAVATVQAQLRLIACCGDLHPYAASLPTFTQVINAVALHTAMCVLLADTSCNEYLY